MTESTTQITDVRKQVIVDIPAARAFSIFADFPIEWWPEKHVFVKDRVAITIEPRVGGRYYERGADGSEIDWGTVVEWDPSRRIVLTWRVGPGWQPLMSDEGASFIEVDFQVIDDSHALVALTHSGLERHGDIAPMIHAALDGPDPGETLAQYARVVERHRVDEVVEVEATGVPRAARIDVGEPITLVNRFTVAGSPDEFEKVFEETSAFFAKQPGFIRHTLMREVGQTTSYVNIAVWSDAGALRAAVGRPEFTGHGKALRDVATSEPKIFTSRQHVES